MAASSFGFRVKDELSSLAPQSKSVALAELSAVVRTGGVLTRLNGKLAVLLVTFSTELARHVRDLCLVGLLPAPRVSGRSKKQIVFDTDAEGLLISLGIFDLSSGEMKFSASPKKELVRSEDEKKAFLRGAFLGGGFVSSGKNRHLEIIFSGSKLRDYAASLFCEIPIDISRGTRDGRYTIYLKSKEKIKDALTYMGALSSSFEMLNEIVSGDMVKKLTAKNNCDMANIDKQVFSAVTQSSAIKKLDEKIGLANLDKKLETTAYCRLGYPEASMSELASILGVSKSCVKHRLDRLVKMAGEIDILKAD